MLFLCIKACHQHGPRYPDQCLPCRVELYMSGVILRVGKGSSCPVIANCALMVLQAQMASCRKSCKSWIPTFWSLSATRSWTQARLCSGTTLQARCSKIFEFLETATVKLLCNLLKMLEVDSRWRMGHLAVIPAAICNKICLQLARPPVSVHACWHAHCSSAGHLYSSMGHECVSRDTIRRCSASSLTATLE